MRIRASDMLEGSAPLLADGGMGTVLFSLGLERGSSPELWNVDHGEEVQAIHRAYVEAGAQILLTNSFGGNRLRLSRHEIGGRAVELNTAAAHLARQEADRADHPVLVGGSIGPSGLLFQPLGELTYEEAYATFAEQAGALASGGVDVIWIETMSDLEEVRTAVQAAREYAPNLPVVVTMTFDTHGHTSMGVSPQAAMQAFSEMSLWAAGGNCGNGPQEIEEVIEQMHAYDPDATLVAKANAGLPRLESGRTIYEATPEDMAAHATSVYERGARIIGACCGSTPEHIRAMGRALRQV